MKIPLSNGIHLDVKVTDAMLVEAIGLNHAQVGMLRAVFEDAINEDPATLSSEEIKMRWERWHDRNVGIG